MISLCEGIGRITAIVLIVALVLVSGSAYFGANLVLKNKNTSTFTTTVMSSNSTVITSFGINYSSTNTTSTLPLNFTALHSAVFDHLRNYSDSNVPAIITGYNKNAVLSWTGKASELDGNYSGVQRIEMLYSSALATVTKINITFSNYVPKEINSTAAEVSYDLNESGSSDIFGPFQGVIIVNANYTLIGSTWQIVYEHWNYVSFKESKGGDGTTFPQWHTPSRESPDPIKNFIFHFGDAFAFAIYVYIIVIGATIVFFKFRKRKNVLTY